MSVSSDRSWCKYAGADLVALNNTISMFGEEVANILGEYAYGIYHLDLKGVEWGNDRYIRVKVIASDLSTFDYNGLTRLVILCHDRGVRMEVQPCNMRYVRLVFTRRNCRDGNICERHPTIDEAIESHRKKYPVESSVKSFEVKK